MNKILIALTSLFFVGLSGQASAVTFTIDSTIYSDSLRTSLASDFNVGQTIYGRLILGIESETDIAIPEPTGASIREPMDLYLEQVFNDAGDLLDPIGYFFDAGSPSGIGSSVTFDYTIVFDDPNEFYSMQFRTSPVLYNFIGSGPAEFHADPGPISVVVSVTTVPAPGALALLGLGLGLMGLSVRRRTAETATQ
jgi:hypothetical protein